MWKLYLIDVFTGEVECVYMWPLLPINSLSKAWDIAKEDRLPWESIQLIRVR